MAYHVDLKPRSTPSNRLDKNYLEPTVDTTSPVTDIIALTHPSDSFLMKHVDDLQVQVDTLKRLVAELLLREKVLLKSETFGSRHLHEGLWRFLDEPERKTYKACFGGDE